MLTDNHVAKIILGLARRGCSSTTPGALGYELGENAAMYVTARGLNLNFLQPVNGQMGYAPTSHLAVRERMLQLAEEESFKVGDKVSYVKGGKVYKGIVKSVGEGKKNKVDFGPLKPSDHTDQKEYDQDELGRDEDK